MKHFNTLYIVLMGLLINCSAAWGMDQSSLLGSPESSQVLPLLINEPNDAVKLAITNQNGSYFNNNFPALINAVPYYMEHAQDDHKSNKNAMNALQIMYYHPESKDKELIFDTLNEIGAGKPVSPILTQKILQPYQGTQVPQLTQIPRIPQIPKNQTLNFDTKLSNINKELKDIQENKILTNKEKLRQINDLYKKLNLIIINRLIMKYIFMVYSFKFINFNNNAVCNFHLFRRSKSSNYILILLKQLKPY